MKVAIIGYGTVSIARIEALNAIPDVQVTAIYSAHLQGEEVARPHNVVVHSNSRCGAD